MTVFIKKKNEKVAYTCQYIVCAGGNQDPVNQKGLAHLAEHAVIHRSCRNAFFRNVKIHGFTSFYYTCYYWYVNTKEEVNRSFCEFATVIEEVKNSIYQKDIFIASRQEIVDEIRYYKDKNARLYQVLSVLDKKISLPMGNIEQISKVTEEDMCSYLRMIYVTDTCYQYVYNEKRDIFIWKDAKWLPFHIKWDKFDNKVIKKELPLRKWYIQCKNRHLEDHTVMLVIQNNFTQSLLDRIVGEIYFIQICKYLNEVLQISEQIEYENFFIKKEAQYLIITIKQVKAEWYGRLLREKEIDFVTIIKKIIEPEGFWKLRRGFLDRLIKLERSTVSEEEIRIGLIRYIGLSYVSCSLLDDELKKSLVQLLEQLEYATYVCCVRKNIEQWNKESIKLIY